MSAIAFDTLKFARKLKQAGVPETQAEAQAEVLAEAFLHNLDELVTRDYLDARLADFEGRIEARLDSKSEVRFAKVDERFDAVDERFGEMDKRFAEIDKRFIEIDGKFRLMYWMMGLIAASTVPAALQQLFG